MLDEKEKQEEKLLSAISAAMKGKERKERKVPNEKKKQFSVMRKDSSNSYN